jgi:hypothetical protein
MAQGALLRKQLAVLVATRVHTLEATLSEHFSSSNRWHVPGYRYLFIDWPFRTVRCSPENKVRVRTYHGKKP